MSDVKCLVSRTSKECKSVGARKLRLQASHSYARLSGRKILHDMNSKSKCRKFNENFTDKVTPHPDKAKNVNRPCMDEITRC